jgi:hypothetical protein
MPRHGFTGKPDDTKIFIIHLLAQLPGPCTRNELQELVMMDDNADYFVYSDALADLIARGLVLTDEEGGLLASGRAREHAEVLVSDLPAALRRHAAAALIPVRRRILRDSTIHAKLEPSEHGLMARLTFSDQGAPFIDIRMAAGSEEQGRILIASWRKHAESIYESILSQLLETKQHADE